MWRMLCFVALTVSLAFGQAAADKPAAARVAQAQVTGEVTALDAAAGTLTIKGEAGEIKLRTDKTVRVMVDGDPGRLDALKVGARAQASYRKEGDQPFLASAVLDEKSIAIAADELNGVEATIDQIAAAEGRKPATLSVTTAAGKKRTLTMPVTAVILKDGDAAKIDAYKVGDKVMVQIRHAGRVDSLKALGDKLSFTAFLSDHTVQAKVTELPNKGNFAVQVEGEANPLPCRLVRGGLVVKGGKVAKIDALAVGDVVYVKYTTKQKGKAQVQGVFPKADWKLFAERLLQRADRAAKQPKPADAPKTDQPKNPPAAGGAG
ncbi:MAG: hypothetical protein HZB16_25135 [Armatimonadetes bacterium]|nr:hypothetical protein [Armatimonadota bacterium]